MTWAAAWKLARNRWAQLAFVGVASFVAGLLVAQRPTAAPTSTPYTAAPTARAAEADKVIEPLDVQTLKPEPKVRAKIARDYRQPGVLVRHNPTKPPTTPDHSSMNGQFADPRGFGPAFAKEIVSEVKFEPAPDGGTALTTIDRATGLPETTVLPKRGLSLRNRWLLGAAYGPIETHDPAKPWAEVWRARAAWTPACRRSACASLEAGVLGGWKETTAYGLLEISIGSR